MYIIVHEGTPDQINTWGELCGDYHTNRDGRTYVEKIIRQKNAVITEYAFHAKEFKTIQAANKVLNTCLEGFTNDESKTLKNQGYKIIEK